MIRRPILGAALLLTASLGLAAPRLVWKGAQVNTLGAPSPDGRWLSFADPATGELAVRELRTSEIRFVTHKSPAEQGQFAYFSVIGPDSRQVAYAWFNEQGFYELRLTTIPDAEAPPAVPRTLYRNPEAGFVQPCAFSPDGKQILTLFFRRDNVSQIALISVADGTSVPLRSLSWIYPKRMDFSPDGGALIYDNASEPGAYERDIFLLSPDGSAETRLLAGPANDLFPLWGPASDAVIFSSDRSGAPGIWSLPVAGGKASGKPQLLADRLGRFLLLGLTRKGDLYVGRRSGDIEALTVDAVSGLANRLLPESEGEARGAAASPDGSTIAYLVRSGPENYGLDSRSVRLYSVAQKISEPLPVKLAHVERLEWSPDGRKLLLAGSDRRARNGVFLYDIAAAKTSPLYLEDDADYRGVDAAWSADGKAVWFVRHGTSLALLDLESREERQVVQARPGETIRLPAVSSGGGNVAYALVGDSGGGQVVVWNSRSKTSTRILQLPSGQLTDLVWSPDSKEILVGTNSNAGLRLWFVGADGAAMRAGPEIAGLAPGARFSADGKSLLVTAGDESEEVWVIEHAARPLDR
jgi:Tol biopolymer transport system component